MAPASVSGRTRHSSRSGRVVRSKTSKKTKDGHEADDAVAAVAEKPDIDELRRRRAAYYSRPANERPRVSTIWGVTPLTRAKTSTASAADRTVPREHKKRRKHGESSKPASRSDRDDRDITADYVYSNAQAPEISRRSSDASRELKRQSSGSTRRTSTLPDDEVTPEDSISQVGVSPASRKSRSSSSRSSLPRAATTPIKLATISEDNCEPGSASKTPRRSYAREPSIFGSLIRRSSISTAPPPPRLVECLTCGSDDVPSASTAKLTCGHRMCHDCLKRVFDMSLKDPAHMPPRCCTKEHIPLKHVDKLFDLKFKVLWNRKYKEYHTKNRIYCPTPKCGEWINPSHIHTSKGRKYAQCPRCTTKVCTSCNAKMHKSSDCPKDPEIANLVAQAKEKGWQTCYSCRAIVELKEGCNHMTCRCLAEFCMLCGSKWKSCECPWFNYRDLPDPDRLTNMRVPEEIRIVYRRVMDAAGIPVPVPVPAAHQQPRAPPPPPAQQQRHPPTYNEELTHRRRQERLDADLARRMQLGLLLNPSDDGEEADAEPRNRHREAHIAAWGLDNGTGGHFMNDNFVSNAANVVMSAFGDAAMGRRGDRESGRRRRAVGHTSARGNDDDPAGDGGLVPNFLGDESVLGVGPSRR
ncbi:Putative IBR domain, Zinc finger, RING-type, E3 ubiquitin ligase RBR family, TRIAD [Septoria linicola]|uniref:RBR-type E3 ubiquitin transferase n=1 Tax=Septoria linicola TaxID=215465 RepID=A0A9Q9B1X8_9PEZI|nr:putative IBR domain, Zinc finger, RING-type, E3 ubiquitin ligase RBR family, TRIAD [Septoria linicola]USW55746.1 Putative IBR domain, Zinc finger, RING-type, E3 ubiquitin ligase RBR family, TRIAD [Septoria linicola]